MNSRFTVRFTNMPAALINLIPASSPKVLFKDPDLEDKVLRSSEWLRDSAGPAREFLLPW